MTDEELDKHLDAVLRAAGSALKYYTLPKSLRDLRSAMRAALASVDKPIKGDSAK